MITSPLFRSAGGNIQGNISFRGVRVINSRLEEIDFFCKKCNNTFSRTFPRGTAADAIANHKKLHVICEFCPAEDDLYPKLD